MTRSRRRGILILLGGLAGILVAVLTGLGIWQVQRLVWKTDLIARTEAQLNAPASQAPVDWDEITAQDEYRRVTVNGTYQDTDVLVQAVTEYGAGFWVMTPLKTSAGWAVWINRGFVPHDRKGANDRERPTGPQQIEGLLRVTQPDGAFLRANRPAKNRWYSRDIAALNQTYDISAAPYFIDAAGGNPNSLPVEGLTIVKFRNAHLSYALTWFAMAAGLAVASFWLLRREWQEE